MNDCAKNITNLFWLVALQLGLFSSTLCAQDISFPYQGLVVSESASVYSGPGKMHYATDSLGPGDIVEVYRHDLNGWCAIRPPQGSFSLVPEAAVKLTGNGFGEITEADIQAWVGTAEGAVEKPLWQVKLKLGEEVQLLGEVSWPDPEGHSTIWYQIAPPNGEFRWIHLDDIQLPSNSLPDEFDVSSNQQPVEISGYYESDEERNDGWRPAKIPFEEQNKIQLATAELQVQQRANGASSNFDSNVVQASPIGTFEETPNENGFLTPKANPGRFQDSSQNNYVGPLPQEQNPIQRNSRPERFASADAAFGANPSGQSLNPISPLGIKLTNRLQALDMRLSAEVTKPEMKSWGLGDIAMDTQVILNRAVSRSEAAAAQRLLDKIDNFRRIQSNASSAENQLRSDSISSSSANNSDSNTRPNAIYDAQGWLNELVLKRGTVDSTYVLEDDQGRITHHVQAAPGLNLHRYLRSKIGIIGQRGYHQQLNLNHVLVERLIVLEKPKR